MAGSVFLQQQCAVLCHRDQHIPCAHLLQFSGIRCNLLPAVQCNAEQFSQFKVVGFNQKRLVFQHILQQIIGSVHYRPNLSAVQICQNLFIDIGRHGIGNTACQNDRIPVLQIVQFPEQCLYRRIVNHRSLSVQFCFFPGFDLHIDSGKSAFQMHKICGNSHLLYAFFDGCPGKACHKAKRTGRNSQFFQNHGNIDALSAVIDLFSVRTVHHSHLHGIGMNDIVDRRVKCHCIDHNSYLLLSVKFYCFSIVPRLFSICKKSFWAIRQKAW